MRRRVVLGLCLFGLSCQQDTSAVNITVTDSAGIRVLTAGDSAAALGVQVALVARPFATVVPEFGDILDVALSPDDHLVVLDPLGPEVVVLDSDAHELSRFGPDGTGPGELRGSGLSKLVLAEDSLWVPDLVNQRLTLFDLGGRVVGEIPLDLAGGLALDWRRLPSGELAFRRWSDPPRIEVLKEGRPQVFATLDWLGVEQVVGPLAPLPVWCVLPNGQVAVARTDRYEVFILQDGAVATILRGTRAALDLAPGDVEHVRDLMLRSIANVPAEQISPELLNRMLEGVIFPEHAPVLGGLICTPTGEVWVQLAQRVESMGASVLKVGATEAYGAPIWEVWNAGANTLDRLVLPRGAHITRVTDDQIVGITTDDLDRETVARWTRR